MPKDKTLIIRASKDHMKEVTVLFDAYRVFYGQETDLKACKAYLEARIAHDESVIFIAYKDKEAIGFAQLYFTFSSATLQSSVILNDLFVDANYRGSGVGALLLLHVQSYAKKYRYKGVSLETAHDNPAQHLYERHGWVKDMEYLHYYWKIQ